MTLRAVEVPAMPPGAGVEYEVAVVEPDAKVRARLALQLADAAAGSYPNGPALLEGMRAGRRTVVVFGPSLADDAGMDEIERLTRSHTEVSAILVVSELSTALLQQALRCGVRDVVGPPVESDSLIEAVARVLGTSGPGPGGAGVRGPEDLGQVISVTSTKGGSGKSVVATNLAVALARRSERPVVLLDADLQFGDVAVMLRLMTSHTVMDAVAAIDRLDAQLLESLLVTHEPSGLRVLPGPTEPAMADRITGADLLRVVEVLQSFHGHVVIDTPAQLNDVVVALLEHSDDVLLVAGLEIPTIKNLRLGLQTLRLLSVPDAKLSLVLNRADSDVQLDVGEVERTLGLRANCLIPSDILVPQTVNKGTPVVLDAPRSGVARAFEGLADRYLRLTAAAPARRRGRFGLF